MFRLLLLDDDPAGLDLRALILRRVGYECHLAHDVNQARTLLFETKPDGIVMDLRLPEARDGLQLIREIHGASPQVCIIVLSGFTEDLLNAPEAAMVSAALEKPVRAEKMIEAVATGLASGTPSKF